MNQEEKMEMRLEEMKARVAEMEAQTRALRTALTQAEAERDLFFRHKQESGQLYSLARNKLCEVRGVLFAGGTVESKVLQLKQLLSGPTVRDALQSEVGVLPISEAADG